MIECSPAVKEAEAELRNVLALQERLEEQARKLRDARVAAESAYAERLAALTEAGHWTAAAIEEAKRVSGLTEVEADEKALALPRQNLPSLIKLKEENKKRALDADAKKNLERLDRINRQLFRQVNAHLEAIEQLLPEIEATRCEAAEWSTVGRQRFNGFSFPVGGDLGAVLRAARPGLPVWNLLFGGREAAR